MWIWFPNAHFRQFLSELMWLLQYYTYYTWDFRLKGVQYWVVKREIDTFFKGVWNNPHKKGRSYKPRIQYWKSNQKRQHHITNIFPSALLSSEEQKLHHAARGSPQGVQLSAAPGGRSRPGAHHPGHPADQPGAQTAARWALLPADQADDTAAAARQPREPLQLEDRGLHVLHLRTDQEHPQIPQVPPEEVRSTSGHV